MFFVSFDREVVPFVFGLPLLPQFEVGSEDLSCTQV